MNTVMSNVMITNHHKAYIKYELLIDNIIDWCYEKFGMSKFQECTPWIDIEDDNTTEMMGEYNSEDNTIILYHKYIDNINDLISTVIHEYTHFLQSPGWYTRYANTLNKSDDHPYEIQAESVAKKHTKICKRHLQLTNRHIPIIVDTVAD